MKNDILHSNNLQGISTSQQALTEYENIQRCSGDDGSRPTPDLQYTVIEKDTYQHLGYLGHGTYGIVDKVKKLGSSNRVYARKTIGITNRNSEALLESAANEFKILCKLNHRHVIQVLEMYKLDNRLSIIMLQVAESNLQEYLEKIDTAKDSERFGLYESIVNWQCCLIQGLDYLHEMKIVHKDLKPANILIQDGHVRIADFGIAKDIIDEETTASLTIGGGQGTPMYMAPEIKSGGRRGRAVDVFSLGCIFLEISTCLQPLGERGALAHFADLRNTSGSRAYSRSTPQVLEWIRTLCVKYIEDCGWHEEIMIDGTGLGASQPILYTEDEILPQRGNCAELAFLMMDPNPKTRITCRQLTTMIHALRESSSFHVMDVVNRSCTGCSTGLPQRDPNLPLHSTFKSVRKVMPGALNMVLDGCGDVSAIDLWENAKRQWLKSHMWW